MKTIGLFGGTFDPIHTGHIAIAESVCSACKLDQVQFIPCFKPPHRTPPLASPQDRTNMVKLAIAHHPTLTLNDIEMRAQTISYTYETALALRKEYPNDSLCFIMGDDSFASFYEWDKANVILENVNIIVVTRGQPPLQHALSSVEDLHNSSAGVIYHHTITPILISATAIRDHLAQGKTDRPELNPDVQKYILNHRLYTL